MRFLQPVDSLIRLTRFHIRAPKFEIELRLAGMVLLDSSFQLVLTAILLSRRSVYLAPAAAVTATLFGLDAWFDVLTAAAGAAWYESLAAALFGRLALRLRL